MNATDGVKILCSHCNHPAWMHVTEYRKETTSTCSHNAWQCQTHCTKLRSDVIYDELQRLRNELAKEKELLDFLDKDIQYSASDDGYGGQQLDYCYWEIRGQCNDVRTAIRNEMEYQKRKAETPLSADNLPF